jgi:hypothetical protein
MIDSLRDDEPGAVGGATPAPADKAARLSSLTATKWHQECVTGAEAVLTTPAIRWRPPLVSGILDPSTELWVKFELFQYIGILEITSAAEQEIFSNRLGPRDKIHAGVATTRRKRCLR